MESSTPLSISSHSYKNISETNMSSILDTFFAFSPETELPPYHLAQLWPLFLGLVIAEYVALLIKGEPPRLAESLNSLAHGIICETAKIFTLGIEVSLYVFVYQKYRLVQLPWESSLTWILAFLGVDLAYYFAHRATHEINFLWAQHQVHHSSEDFNTAVAVRHPISHSWINSLFYLPLALFIPPPHCMAHQQFHLVYKAWLHTPLIGKLGPLEYFLNTPTHHKVHHGCNLYVLDKNFGGFLIIWDRLFNTFQDLRPNEELVFGIVFQHQSFNPFWQMWHKFPGLWERFKKQNSWTDSIKVLFYGPSWVEGVNAPRLGRDEDKFDIRPRPKFNVKLPSWLNTYVMIHFLGVAGIFHQLALHKGVYSQLSVYITLIYIIWTLTNIGFLSEGNPWGPASEVFRCLFVLGVVPASFQPYSSIIFVPSALIWLFIGGFRPLELIKDSSYHLFSQESHISTQHSTKNQNLKPSLSSAKKLKKQ